MEKPRLLLYVKTGCPFCHKALKVLDELNKNIPQKNISESSEAKEELEKKGGKVQVPCLMINNTALYESDAIIDWLEDNQGLL